MAVNVLPFFFFFSDPTEVYMWGNNTNFSLGHGNQESRQHPELVDMFARTGVYIKQVRRLLTPVVSSLRGPGVTVFCRLHQK